MESGYHSALWFDLDALFAATSRVHPFIAALAGALRPYDVDVVCGPLRGGAFLAQCVAQALDAEFWYTEPLAPIEPEGLYRARYRLPTAFDGRLEHPRVALVDDVMSAASSLRASRSELRAHNIEVVAVGALLVLGNVGAAHFADEGVPVEAVARGEFEMWAPGECPLCAEDVPLEKVISPTA